MREEYLSIYNDSCAVMKLEPYSGNSSVSKPVLKSLGLPVRLNYLHHKNT